MSDIQLYITQSDRKKVKKNVSLVVDITQTFRIKEPSSVFNPEILLSRETVGDKYAAVNYAYVPKWERWYFIDDIIEENDGLIRYRMSVDVLMTYADKILASQQEVIRSEKINSMLFADSERPVQSQKYITYTDPAKGEFGAFPEATGDNYFLTVAGGVGSA